MTKVSPPSDGNLIPYFETVPSEILHLIMKELPCTLDYMSFIMTCKRIYNFYKQHGQSDWLPECKRRWSYVCHNYVSLSLQPMVYDVEFIMNQLQIGSLLMATHLEFIPEITMAGVSYSEGRENGCRNRDRNKFRLNFPEKITYYQKSLYGPTKKTTLHPQYKMTRRQVTVWSGEVREYYIEDYYWTTSLNVRTHYYEDNTGKISQYLYPDGRVEFYKWTSDKKIPRICEALKISVAKKECINQSLEGLGIRVDACFMDKLCMVCKTKDKFVIN